MKHAMRLLQVGPSIVIAIAANKQDLQKERTVSAQESAGYAASIHALHVGTSAKTGEGLQDVFQAIADHVVAKSPCQGTEKTHTVCCVCDTGVCRFVVACLKYAGKPEQPFDLPKNALATV